MPIYSGDLQPAHSVSFLWALPGLPAVAAVVLAAVAAVPSTRLGAARRLGRIASALAVIVTAATVGMVVAAALGVLLPLPAGARLLVDAPWVLVDTGIVTVSAALSLEPVSAALSLAVALVGAVAQVLLAAEARATARRAAAVSAAVAASLLVVLADNFGLVLAGWEVLALAVIALAGLPDDEAASAAPPASSTSRGQALAEAVVVSRVGQVAWLGGVVLLFWGLGGGVISDGPRAVTADVRGAPGADIELRTVGDRAPVASVRQVPVGPTLAPRELAVELDLRDTGGLRPFEQSLRAQRVGPVSLLFLVCLGFLLGAVGLGAAAALALGEKPARGAPSSSSVDGAVVAVTIAAACLTLPTRVWFLFELCPPATVVAAALAALAVAAGVLSAARRRPVVASLARRALRELGVMPAGDFARATAWLDRFVLGPAGGVAVVAVLVTVAILVVRR